MRVYKRALSEAEIAQLAQRKALVGRIRSITDRNGYAVNVSYQSFTQQQIQDAPDLQMQIDQVSDPYGRTATFSYLPTQVSGRWVVDQIDFPNGHKAVYGYANGQLATVTFDDGTQSTFTYGADSVSQCTTVGYFDVAAEGSHRTKTAYLTNNFTLYAEDTGYAGDDFNEDIFSQSSMLVRMIANGSGEVSYLNSLQTTWNVYVYRGAGCVRQIVNAASAQYFTNPFNYVVSTGDQFGGTAEPSYFSLDWTLTAGLTGTCQGAQDAQGCLYGYQFDSDTFVTEVGYSDGTQYSPGTTEQFSYDEFKQITRYQDRNKNVTLYSYDGNGNLLSKEVGLKYVPGQQYPPQPGVDTPQPEYAKYQWTYYAAGEPNQFLMASAVDARGNSTQFVYDNNHRLVQVVEPPDAQGDAQAATTIAYDSASRVQQITDPNARLVQYAYDQRDRVATITYGDSSTERFIYGSPGSGNENLLVRQKDRNGVTSRFDYDAAGRVTTTTFAYSKMDQNDNETPITDPSVTVTKVCTYLDGTDLVSSCTERGETTTYGYDYRQRLVTTTVQPRVGVTLTTTRTYLNNLLFSETDPYGRTKYFGYRTSDAALIREIQGTVPSFTLADFNAVMNQTRDATPNAQFLITDYQLDGDGQRVATIDGNNNTLAQSFDSRGHLVQAVEASGTPIAATTGCLYDANGNLIEERSPRYYDSNDPQVGNCRTQMTYTGRNLLATRTEAPGTSVAATVQYFYNLDQTVASMIDARNNTWQTLWSACCAGRKTADLDPTAASTATEYDYAGNPTFVQVVQGTTIYNQTTTQYDARHRPILRTIWLTTAPNVDPNNPPIAGQNGVPAASGLTTQWYYDENLADDVGLSSTAGQNIAGIGNVSIQPLLAQVQSDGITFGAGSDGYAVLEVKPDGELWITIQDGAHRTVASGAIQPPTGQNPNQPITWSTRLDDNVATVSSPGNLLETAHIDALGNINRQREDGAERLLQSVDAESNVTAATFDANSNQLSVADPNSVGYTAVFDARNRETSRTDTMNATTQAAFDGNSNLVKSVDAKSNSSTAVFDARDRRVSLTGRIGGTTSWGLDGNSNVVSLTDSESNTTQFSYDPRNLKTAEIYADNNPPSANDQVTFVYDGARRIQTRTDQLGDYVTMIYDMARRLTAREYRDSTKQPTDPPNDTDSFTFDGGAHMLTAVSGRYSNTLTLTYDQAGRLASESLTVGGQTYSVGRTYDAANRLVSIAYPDGSAVAQNFTARGLLEQINYQGNVAASFTYDPAGRRATRTLGDTPGTTTTWGYVTGGDLIASISTPSLPSFAYTYDANTNMTGESITGVLQHYGFSAGAAGYDAQDRLVAWSRADGNDDESWTLTTADDWSQFANASGSQTRTHNNAHELTAVNGVALSYDAKGNLVSDGMSGASYTWDFDNRLSSAAAGAAATTFTYDALGRRTSMTTAGATTIFLSAASSHDAIGYPYWRTVSEYTAGGPPATPLRNYIGGPGPNEWIALYDGTQGYYYFPDALLNISFLSDSAGTLVETYTYGPYGETQIYAADAVTARASSAVGNSVAFTGHRYDISTGGYYCNARYYDPSLGRFLSRDPIGFNAESKNLYTYVNCSPTNAIDPSGLMGIPFILPKVIPKKPFGGGTIGNSDMHTPQWINCQYKLDCDWNDARWCKGDWFSKKSHGKHKKTFLFQVYWNGDPYPERACFAGMQIMYGSYPQWQTAIQPFGVTESTNTVGGTPGCPCYSYYHEHCDVNLSISDWVN